MRRQPPATLRCLLEMAITLWVEQENLLWGDGVNQAAREMEPPAAAEAGAIFPEAEARTTVQAAVARAFPVHQLC